MRKIDTVSFISREIASAKIKYETLDKIFAHHMIKQKHVVFYIDLIAVLCRAYSKSTWSTDAMSRVPVQQLCLSIVVEVMNVIAHYRKYLTFKLHKSNTIIVSYDTKLSDYQASIYPELRRDRMSWYTNDHPTFGTLNQAAKMAYEYIKTLCVYFDDIYCTDRDCGVDTITVMSLIMGDKRYRDSYHILFTRNLIAGQLCKNGVCSILYNKRDNSVLLTEDNILTDGFGKLNGRKATGRAMKLLSNGLIGVSMIPYILMLTSTEKILPMVKNLNWSFSDGIEVIHELMHRSLISNGVSIVSFLDALETLSAEMNKKVKKENRKYTATKRKSLRMSDEFRKKAKEYDRMHAAKIDIPTGEKHLPEEYVFELTDEVYKDLINRYRVVAVPITLAAVTKEQIIRIYSRMYNLFNQEYLEKINDLLSEMGPTSNLIEIGALNSNIPVIETGYNENEW